MGLVINTNIASLSAQNNLASTNAANATALERLSSGLRINSAADDAAGLAISTGLTAQIEGTDVAIRNANDGISLAQTAEGALDSVTDNLLRIRELALQSANDTNSPENRAALQLEVAELVDEINDIGLNTTFNGLNLLDGSLGELTLQTGANVGETVQFEISQATADSLGAAATAGVTNSSPTGIDGNTSPEALAAGDLVINGISVPATSGLADSASTANEDASAIAIASAINSVSDQSGVTAIVNETVAAGSSFTAADVSGNITINGVDINVATDANLSDEANLQNVVTAINEQSGATGVTASFSGDPTVGITLTADDGRNIALENGTANTDAIGLATGGAAGTPQVFTGTVTLVSDDGSDIEIGSTTGDIDNAGFELGTFSGSNSVAVGDNVTDVLETGDLVINGVAVGPSLSSTDTASTANSDASAISIAAAINAISDQTGVTAVANENVVTSDEDVIDGGNLDATVTINGVDIAITTPDSASTSDQLSAVITAINAESGRTGVTAVALDSDQFQLIAEDGRNIEIGGNAADIGLTAGVEQGSVALVSGGPIELSTTTGNIDNSGFTIGTFGSNESGQLLTDLDISTVEGALAAVTAVDNALGTISAQQAELGAIQNRLDTTISNLNTLSINLSAANSQILDADFAEETAELSRTTVLQSAGISVLAQANAAPNAVLSLLP